MEKQFHSNLKNLRVKRGMTQPEVAKRMAQLMSDDKFQQQHYSRIETGRGEPTLRQLIAICRTFAVSSDWLLGICEESECSSQDGMKPSFGARLDEVKRNAAEATASINALESAIEKLNKTI